jgi:putative PIN family toxin of toxin-antitoxin system
MLRTSTRQATVDGYRRSALVMKPALTRLVIDTNVLLDWLVFDDPASVPLATAVVTRQAQWIATTEMLEEFTSVLARPLSKRWEDARKRALTLEVDLLCERWLGPLPAAAAGLRCSDVADQKFIDLAIACGACALITRDRALLDLRPRARPHGVSIVSPAEWSASGEPAAVER